MAVKGSATVTLTSYRDTQSVTRYYKLQTAGSSAPSKPTTKPPSSDWTDLEPDCDISKELYFCDLTIFSNGEWEYSSVSKSSSYEAAKEAYNKAQNASETLKAESARIDNLETGKANIADLNAEKARIDTLETNKADITSLNAGIARIDTLEAGKADIDLANVNNAWITNGVIKDASIANEKVISVSANKLTAGTIDASKITVTNLNADNITVGTINGARIGNNSIDLNKLSQEVPTKEYLDSVEQKLQGEIDGAIETFTVSQIPTLNNEPAVNWTTDDIKSTHIGDLCYVVNNASDNDGFCYRFQYNGTVYSWALIKDNDVTKAIQDIAELGGEVTQFKTDYTSKVSEIDGGIESLKSRTTTIETTYSTKTYTDTKTSDALTSANSYADNKASSTLTEANSYADNKASTTLSSAKTYADSTASSTLTSANDYADGKANKALTDANKYTDTAANNTLTSANTYSDNKASDALTSANSYADTKASSALTDAKSYTDSTASSTLGEAKSYTDTATADMATTGDIPTKVSELTNDSNFATTTQVSTAKSEAISTASADATSKANSALDSAKSYTDAIEIGGRNLLRNSKNLKSFTNEAPTYISMTFTDADVTVTGTKNILGIYCDISVEGASDYTISFNAADISGTCKYSVGGNTSIWSGLIPYSTMKEGRTEVTFKTYDTTTKCRIYFSCHSGNDSFRLWNVKLEKGNKATDWTPAPEDVEAGIANAQTSADSAASAAANAQDDIDNLEVGGRNYLLNTGFKSVDPYDYTFSDGRRIKYNIDNTYQKFGNNTVKLWAYAPVDKTAYVSAPKIKDNWKLEDVLGRPITISMWVYVDSIENTKTYCYEFRIVYTVDGVKQWNKIDTNYPYNIPPNLSEGWNYIYATYSIPSNATEAYFNFALNASNDKTNYIWVTSPKAEVGTKYTSWTPAPEDVDAGIANAQTTADSAASAAANAQKTADTAKTNAATAQTAANNAQTTANEAKAKAEAAQTAVSTKVETSVFNTLKNTVDENSANITSLTETVTTKADSSTVTTLSNTVNNVKQTADANSSSISKLTTTVNSKADGSKVTALENKTSTIEQNLSGVTTRVSNLESENDGLDTRLTAAESKITADAIVSTVTSSKTYKDALSGKVDTSTYNTKMEQLDNSISLKATATDVYTKTQADSALATAKSEAISSANSYTDTATTDMATKEYVTSQGYLTVTSDAITSKVSKNEVISAINQTAESVSINANKINLNGAVTFSSFDNSLQTTINNKAETSALEDVRTIANNAHTEIENLELTKIDRFGTNASMKWNGNILKIEALDPETNVPYAVEIGGNGIEFKYDNEAVAMINQDQLVIDKTVVLTEMQVNRYWTWRTRDNNNLCLQWIGGSN